jgi:hypothetical protein
LLVLLQKVPTLPGLRLQQLAMIQPLAVLAASVHIFQA